LGQPQWKPPYTDDTRYIDRSKVSSIATLIGRIGYTVEPATLLYLKGGAAWVGDTFTEECSPAVDVCPGVAKVTRTGWTIGGGLEHQFAQDWSGLHRIQLHGLRAAHGDAGLYRRVDL